MYGHQPYSGQIYSKLIEDKPNQPVLASLVERCLKEVDWGERQKIQSHWTNRCSQAISQIADSNPYLPSVVAGQEVPAVHAVAWVDGSRGGFDCRPKLFDGISKTWKLCDTGSMVTVVKRSKDDKKDFSRVLQAVNGSNITVYGQKEISVQIGRKEYKIQATIADVEEDILGWDFFNKYKLTFDYSEFGDLYIIDK